MPKIYIETPRLILRDWRDEDLPAFAAMNADLRVMKYLNVVLDRSGSDAYAGRLRQQITETGYGRWAVEVPGVASFIGFVGIYKPNFEASFTPCIDIGWRLDFEHWNKGYTTEAATAVLAYSFDKLGLPEIVSFTSPLNIASWRVMEKIGMRCDPADDFDHPMVEEGNPLRRHLLYKVSATAFQEPQK